jgi:hypothetical protein
LPPGLVFPWPTFPVIDGLDPSIITAFVTGSAACFAGLRFIPMAAAPTIMMDGSSPSITANKDAAVIAARP